MKRTFALLCLLTAALIVQAVGPKIPCMLSCDPPIPGENVTGAFFYWRLPGATNFVDTQRIAIPLTALPFDLRILGLPKGDYVAAMTWTNAWGESDLSDTIVWHYSNPNKPTNEHILNP